MSEEYGNDILTLTDDTGIEMQFEMIDALEKDGSAYLALIPYLGSPDNLSDFDGELVILKAVQDESGEDILISIEDEDEFDAVLEEFEKRLEDEFEIEE